MQFVEKEKMSKGWFYFIIFVVNIVRFVQRLKQKKETNYKKSSCFRAGVGENIVLRNVIDLYLALLVYCTKS